MFAPRLFLLRAAHRVGSALALDARSVSVMRIALGVLVLLDLGERARLLHDFYTDSGLVTRADALSIWSRLLPSAPRPWSLHLLSGSGVWQALLFALQALCAIALIIGYRTRIASIGACVLLVSLCQRNLLVTGGDDWALVAFLFWAMFMPLDRVLSLQAGHARARNAETRVSFVSGPWPSSTGFTAQLVMILFFAGLQKIVSSAAWRSGDAVALLLRDPVLTTELGHWLGTLPPSLGRLLNHGVLLAELAVPWLLLVPVSAAVRTAAIVFIGANLLGFAAALDVGRLPWVVLAALAAHLPGAVWQKLGWIWRESFRPLDFSPRASIELARIGLGGLLVHALLANACRLGRDRAEPPWIDAPAGFAVPRQGWGMFREVAPGRGSDWIVVSAARQGDAEATLRLPDGAPLVFGPESNVKAIHGNLRWAYFWSYPRMLAADHPDVLQRYLQRQCEAQRSIALEHTEVTIVGPSGPYLRHEPIARRSCEGGSLAAVGNLP